MLGQAPYWLTYEFAAKLLSLALPLGWSLRVRGQKNLPASGAALLIANHQSYLDPPTIGVGYKRHLSFLARKTLFDNSAFGFLLHVLNAVPVDQDGVGIDGIRAILAKLEQGHPVLIFPEGSRSEDGSLLPLQPGVSLLIKRAHCPIIPVGIMGAFAAWNRWQKLPRLAPLFLPANNRCLAVSYGPPRDPASIAHLPRQEMLDILAADIAAEMVEAEKIRRK